MAETCSSCGGSGSQSCSTTQQTTKTVIDPTTGKSMNVTIIETCSKCNGNGSQTCSGCGGSGER